MKKQLLSTLNDISIVVIITMAVKISERSLIGGITAFIISYICLDAHTYFSKKLDFHNNPFIKN
jgi:hypothetical protein